MSVRVTSWIWEHSPVEHRGDLLVLLVLADHAQDDGAGAYPSVGTIARKARLSERGARLALRNLEAGEAIQRIGRGPTGTFVYRVSMGGQPLPPAATAPGSGLPEGGHSATENLPLTAPEPSLTVKEPTPPTPPTGGRARDQEAFREEVSLWIAAELPSLAEAPKARVAVAQALGAGAQSLVEVEAFLAQWWPQLPSGRKAS